MQETHGTVTLRGTGRTVTQHSAKIMYYSTDGGRRLIGLPLLLPAGIVIGQNAMSITQSVTESIIEWEDYIRARSSRPTLSASIKTQIQGLLREG